MSVSQFTYYYKQVTKPVAKAALLVASIGVLIGIVGFSFGSYYFQQYQQLSQTDDITDQQPDQNQDSNFDDRSDQENIADSSSLYSVVCGDTLWSIAEDRYGDGWLYLQVAQVNQIKNPDQIEVDQKLVLPAKQELLSSNTQIDKPISSENYRIDSISIESASGEKREKGSYNNDAGKLAQAELCPTYTVQLGDSLWSISEQNLHQGMYWNSLYELNKRIIGSNPNLIQPGMILTMPERWATRGEDNRQPCMPE